MKSKNQHHKKNSIEYIKQYQHLNSQLHINFCKFYKKEIQSIINYTFNKILQLDMLCSEFYYIFNLLNRIQRLNSDLYQFDVLQSYYKDFMS